MPATSGQIERHVRELPEELQHDVGVGTEIHGAIFVVAGLAYIWLMTVAWVSFGLTGYADLDLSVASVIFVMIMTITLLVYVIARSHLTRKLPAWDEFFKGNVDTHTGPVPGWQAGLEIAMIPIVLAFSATLIGIVWMLTPSGGASPG